MLIKIISISTGAVIGALGRYFVGDWAHKYLPADFPYGTMVVNLSGCLVIGILWGMFEKFEFSSNLRLFLFIGILGSYTTFSSFGLETFNLLRDGEIKFSLINMLASNIFGVILVFAGYGLVKAIFSIMR